MWTYTNTYMMNWCGKATLARATNTHTHRQRLKWGGNHVIEFGPKCAHILCVRMWVHSELNRFIPLSKTVHTSTIILFVVHLFFCLCFVEFSYCSFIYWFVFMIFGFSTFEFGLWCWWLDTSHQNSKTIYLFLFVRIFFLFCHFPFKFLILTLSWWCYFYEW